MLKNNMVGLDHQQEQLQPKQLQGIMQREQKLKMGPGMHFFTKMTVIRLQNNDLFVISPIKLNEELIKEIQCFGNVKYIVSPNKFHHLQAGFFKEQFPNAILYGADGLDVKRPDVKFDFILKGESSQDASYQQPPWTDEIEYFLLEAAPKINEVVFYHKASKSLICTELVMNLTENYKKKFNCCQKCMLSCTFMKFNKVITPTNMFLNKTNKKQLQANLERILQWDIQYIIPAHGDIIQNGDMKEIIRQAWVKVMQD